MKSLRSAGGSWRTPNWAACHDLDEAGLRHDAISLRVTGCPNGCSRPYLAEIGYVGKAPGKYALYLGAKYNGTRLNRLYRQSVTVDESLALLGPIIKRYALERQSGEEFGDFCLRTVLTEEAAPFPASAS